MTCASLSAAILSASASRSPSSFSTRNVYPFNFSALLASCELFAIATFDFRATISFCLALSSSCRVMTRGTSSSVRTFREVHSSFTALSLDDRNGMTAVPQTASTLRTPAAIPVSLMILKMPMSVVFRTCVPPHSSIETPGTSITLTSFLSYFSPNMATAPRFMASSNDIDDAAVSCSSAIQSLTILSTDSSSSGESGLEQLKSKRSLESSTREPA
mmetsp:Transcript_6516/g.19777  ORF Transcript_6516/g.19777 Transcript_6516/m.19777 type:complete len:216 (+) Transcript_6516:415-1062(+)